MLPFTMQKNQINSNSKTEYQLELLDKKSQLKLLNELVKDAISEEWDESTRKIFFFIKRSLRQFKLYGQLQESDILTQAYIRVRQKIESGELIQNMPAYLNRVAFNIVREESRKQKKSEDLPIRLNNNGHGNLDTTPGLDDTNSYQITTLIQALKELKSEDLEIIQLRIVKGLSWKEVSINLSSNQCSKISESTLRQKGKRALQRLRNAYLAVEKSYVLEAGGKK